MQLVLRCVGIVLATMIVLGCTPSHVRDTASTAAADAGIDPRFDIRQQGVLRFPRTSRIAVAVPRSADLAFDVPLELPLRVSRTVYGAFSEYWSTQLDLRPASIEWAQASAREQGCSLLVYPHVISDPAGRDPRRGRQVSVQLDVYDIEAQRLVQSVQVGISSSWLPNRDAWDALAPAIAEVARAMAGL